MAHVEVIKPTEKLAPPLGTGYQLPAKPATRAELLADLVEHEGDPIGLVVWKVKRKSVSWSASYLANRRVRVHGNRIEGHVVGSTQLWWFFAVDIAPAKRLLSRAPSGSVL